MATELEVPYATLIKQLQREPLRSWITPFLTMKGNTKYITEEGERVIRWQYPEKEPKIKELEELLVEKENQVTKLVEMIRRELEEKNARIRQLEEELEAEHKKNELLRSIQERLQKIEQSVNGTPLRVQQRRKEKVDCLLGKRRNRHELCKNDRFFALNICKTKIAFHKKHQDFERFYVKQA